MAGFFTSEPGITTIPPPARLWDRVMADWNASLLLSGQVTWTKPGADGAAAQPAQERVSSEDSSIRVWKTLARLIGSIHSAWRLCLLTASADGFRDDVSSSCQQQDG